MKSYFYCVNVYAKTSGVLACSNYGITSSDKLGQDLLDHVTGIAKGAHKHPNFTVEQCNFIITAFNPV